MQAVRARRTVGDSRKCAHDAISASLQPLAGFVEMIVQADVFQTLADPTRRRIVELLRDEEQAVNDIVAQVGVRQSGVSRHLRILSEAGFVQVRPVGVKRLYSLRPEPFRALDEWVTGYRGLFEGRLDRFAAALDQAQNKTSSKSRTEPT